MVAGSSGGREMGRTWGSYRRPAQGFCVTVFWVMATSLSAPHLWDSTVQLHVTLPWESEHHGVSLRFFSQLPVNLSSLKTSLALNKKKKSNFVSNL